MIRPATALLLTLAAGAGAALFHVSYDVAALEDRLATLNRDIVADQEAVHVLRAEWSFLNQPARLEELSRRYLDLQPLDGAQIGSVAMLPARLPVPDDIGPDAAPATALAALTGRLAGPQPLLKPLPPARAPARTPTRPAPPTVAPTQPSATVIPVAARTLDDVLADLTHGGGGR